MAQVCSSPAETMAQPDVTPAVAATAVGTAAFAVLPVPSRPFAPRPARGGVPQVLVLGVMAMYQPPIHTYPFKLATAHICASPSPQCPRHRTHQSRKGSLSQRRWRMCAERAPPPRSSPMQRLGLRLQPLGTWQLSCCQCPAVRNYQYLREQTLVNLSLSQGRPHQEPPAPSAPATGRTRAIQGFGD